MQAVHTQIRTFAAAAGDADVAALPDHAERLGHLVAKIPAVMWHKISHAVREKYHGLEARYGPRMAAAIVAAGVVGTAVPLPLTNVIAMAPLIGLAELHHQLHPGIASTGATVASEAELPEAEVARLGKEWVQDLTELVKPG